MADRSGYSTHEYTTGRIIKHFLTCLIIGFILGVTAALVGVYTSIYQDTTQTVFDFLYVHWWVSPFLFGALAIAVYVDHRSKSKKTHGRF